MRVYVLTEEVQNARPAKLNPIRNIRYSNDISRDIIITSSTH